MVKHFYNQQNTSLCYLCGMTKPLRCYEFALCVYRECILCLLCCSCAWACHWSTAPSSPRSWESCNSTSTIAGLMWSFSLALCPASSSSTWHTNRHPRSTWPCDLLNDLIWGRWTEVLSCFFLLFPRGLFLISPGLNFLNQEVPKYRWFGLKMKVDCANYSRVNDPSLYFNWSFSLRIWVNVLVFYV